MAVAVVVVVCVVVVVVCAGTCVRSFTAVDEIR